jgi:hypothetical protein
MSLKINNLEISEKFGYMKQQKNKYHNKSKVF